MTTPIKMLGVGSPILDMLVNVPEGFLRHVPGAKGGMELVDQKTIADILSKSSATALQAPGGSAANTIYALSKLGVPTGLLGKVGDDENGKFYLRNYAAAGGDASRVKSSPSTPTGTCLCLVTPDSQRTMRTCLGAAAELSLDDISPEDFEGYTHAHVEGYMLFNQPLTAKILQLATKAGLVISLDLSSFEVVRANRAILADIIKNHVDILFANEDEAKEYLGRHDPEAFISEFKDVCDVVAVKLGKEGALIKTPREKAQIKALVVDAIDTTGAGDLWQAGFLYGHLAGETLEVCGRHASLLGAEVVKIMGAHLSEETWRRIRSLTSSR